jgi:hypothetical protein
MANVKITELTAATALAGTDVLPIVDVGADATKKVSVSDLLRNLPDGTASAPALAFADDQNTGVLSPAANELAFATSGTQRLVIDSSGNVGIGTTSPTRELQVSAAVPQVALLSSDSTICEYLFGDVADDNVGRIRYEHATNNLSFWTNASERLRIDSSGRVGIGTSSPSNNLDILSTTSGATVSARVGSTASSGVNNANLIINNGGTGNATLRFDYESSTNRASIGVPQSTQALFFTTAGSERLRIDSSGNVGVGATSPVFGAGSGLEVFRSGVATVRVSSNTQAVELRSDAGTGTLETRGSFPLKFGTAGSERMRIDSSGNVGVGLTPTAKFHVGGTIQSQTGSTVAQMFTDGGAAYFTSVGAYPMLFQTNGSERARIDSSGRLLVGTTAVANVPYGSQIESSSTSGVAISNLRFSNNAFGPTFQLGKSRATTVNSYTVVNSGDTLGQLVWVGADGTDMLSQAASILAAVDGTPGTNDMPGRLVFSTTADGASSPTEALRLDKQQRMYNLQAYTATTGSSANVVVLSDGRFLRSTSSNKYKTNIETLEDSYADAVLNCRPVWYQSTTEADNPEHGHWGFIAEEVAAIDPRLCFFKEEEDGRLEPEGVQYDRFVPHLLNLIKRQQSAIETLESKVAALEAQ